MHFVAEDTDKFKILKGQIEFNREGYELLIDRRVYFNESLA